MKKVSIRLLMGFLVGLSVPMLSLGATTSETNTATVKAKVNGFQGLGTVTFSCGNVGGAVPHNRTAVEFKNVKLNSTCKFDYTVNNRRYITDKNTERAPLKVSGDSTCFILDSVNNGFDYNASKRSCNNF